VGVFWVLKHPFSPEIISNFLVRQLCLFVQQNIYGINTKQSKIHAGMQKTHHFDIKMQKFSGDPDPTLFGA